MRVVFLLLLIFGMRMLHAQDTGLSVRQTADTLRSASTAADSLPIQDSVVRSTPKTVLAWKDDTTFFNSFKGPLLPKQKATMQIAAERPFQSKDDLFYLLAGMFIFFGLVRFFFPKYIQSIFSLLFQTSFRQKQTRDQLLQDRLASIMLNILFFAVTGLFATLALLQMNIRPAEFWEMFAYTSLGLLVIYVVKYLFLLFFGLLFNVREPAITYAFIVFLINKIIGILLLPIVLILAFSEPATAEVIMVVGICLLILFFVYRYIAALAGLRSDLRVNALHFFIYLCAVEVAPLLVIFKLLANQIGPSI